MSNNSNALPMWTVYERPKDYPALFVARLFFVRSGSVVAAREALFSSTLEGLRAKLPPGLVRFPRNDGDEPHIIETWL